MKIDFHIHTIYSKDSLTKLKDLAKKSKRLGIVPVITDHNTIKGALKFKEFGLEYIIGEEIKTDKGDLIGLFLNEEIKKGTNFYEALDLIKEQGGIAYLPHMYDNLRKGVGEEKVEIIEVINGRATKEVNEKAKKWAKKNNLLMAGGSDAHFLFEFGQVWTEIEGIELEPKNLLKALKNSKIKTNFKIHPIIARNLTPFVIGYKKLLKPLR